MPSKKSQPGPARRPPGRPKGAEPPIPVTGFRIPPALLERLDALVAARNAELAALGATVNRTSLMVAALGDYCDRAEAAGAARS